MTDAIQDRYPLIIPDAHATSHEPGGSDEVSGVVPGAHQATHVSGADQIPDATALTRGLMTTVQVSKLADIVSPLLAKGSIAAASDFPTAAAVQTGWFYFVTADVTDNDPTKTNTGLSFKNTDEIVWTGATWKQEGRLPDYVTTPAALGVAAAGTAALASPADHRHVMPNAAAVGADPAGTAAGLDATLINAAGGLINPSVPTNIASCLDVPIRAAMAVDVTQYLATGYILCTLASAHGMAAGDMVYLSDFVTNPTYNTAAGTTVAMTSISQTSFTLPTVPYIADESGTVNFTSSKRISFTGKKPDQSNKYWSCQEMPTGSTETVLSFQQSTLGYNWTEHCQMYNGGFQAGQLRTKTGGSAAANAYTVSGDANTGINFPGLDQFNIACGGVDQLKLSTAGQLTTFTEKTTANTGQTATTAEIGSSRLVNFVANAAGTDTWKLPVGAAGINGVMARIHNSGTGNLTISCDTTGTINGAATVPIPPGSTLQCEYHHADTDWKVT